MESLNYHPLYLPPPLPNAVNSGYDRGERSLCSVLCLLAGTYNFRKYLPSFIWRYDRPAVMIVIQTIANSPEKNFGTSVGLDSNPWPLLMWTKQNNSNFIWSYGRRSGKCNLSNCKLTRKNISGLQRDSSLPIFLHKLTSIYRQNWSCEEITLSSQKNDKAASFSSSVINIASSV